MPCYRLELSGGVSFDLSIILYHLLTLRLLKNTPSCQKNFVPDSLFIFLNIAAAGHDPDGAARRVVDESGRAQK